ncbi:hypothetical protein BU17DRAFT_90669 [Hysterangium stoloniferum]|nr:hypothetical protein BU17DRAFT_90669 [Hysterangium stoloniferum]
MPGRSTTTISNLREAIDELPPLISRAVLGREERDQIIGTGMKEIFRTKLRERWSCYETGHDLCYRGYDGDQHIPLSPNHGEFWVNVLCDGNTSSHGLPTFGKTSWSSINAMSNLRDGVDELPPLDSPHVLNSEQWYQIINTGMREIFRAKLRER